jgi:hypothetical protein
VVLVRHIVHRIAAHNKRIFDVRLQVVRAKSLVTDKDLQALRKGAQDGQKKQSQECIFSHFILFFHFNFEPAKIQFLHYIFPANLPCLK